MEAIMALLDQQNAIYDYLQSVWIPLLKQVDDPDAPFHVNEPSELQRKYLSNNAKNYKKQRETSAAEKDIYFVSMSRNPRTVEEDVPRRSAGVSL